MRGCFLLALALLPFVLSSASAQNSNDPNHPYDPDAHTVALYHLDEGAGAVARDASGNGLDATIVGATWTAEGRFDAGMVFDGDDYLSLPLSELYTSNDLTLEAWVYATDIDPGLGAVIIDGWFSALNGGGRRLGINPNRRPYALARVDLGPFSQVVGRTQIPRAQWVHLAAVFDGTQGRIRVVVNGQIEADEPMTTGNNAFHRLTVGRDLLSPSEFFTGKIDEIRVSDAVRELLPVPVPDATWGAIKAIWRD
jgi:hypothetical protein